MLTPHDFEIVDFIKEFKAVTIDNISKLFYPNHRQGRRIASRRLLEIWKNRERTGIARTLDTTKKLIYYVPPKSQLVHKNLITECYVRFKIIGGKIKTFVRENNIYNLQPDFFIIYEFGNLLYHFFFEIQLAHSCPDIKKYESLIGRPLPWPVFPRVVVVTNYKQINYNGPINYLVLPVSLEGFQALLEPPRKPSQPCR